MDLVADAVPGNLVAAVLEGHPAIRRDWLWGADLPFSRALYDVGDVESLTDSWVLITHMQPGRPLVEA
eukprot:11807997-Prorocentrum_lima.AAC.1